MSKIKKMKLIPINENLNDKNELIKNAIVLETKPNTIKTSQIEYEMDNLLASDIDEKTKVDLFVQLLRNFLTYKDKINQIPRSKSPEKVNKQNSILNYFSPISSSTPQESVSNVMSSNLTQNSPSKYFTTNVITPRNKKIRKKKTIAEKKIKKMIDLEKSITSDADSEEDWIQYKAPKNIKTISRLRAKK